MDLVKAEAVNALVNALTAQAHRSAARRSERRRVGMVQGGI